MIRLRSFEFRREREPSWRELEDLLRRLERGGLRALDAVEIARLPVLYRAALSSLSVARSISLDQNLLLYLESLAARAYVHVHGTRRRFLETLVDFFRSMFPRTVRRHAWALGLAVLFTALGAVSGWLLTAEDPDRFHSFVSEQMAQGRGPEASTEELREALYARDRNAPQSLVAFATFLFRHNSEVGMLCFALGFLAGIPVFLLLLFNGLLLGAFGALYGDRGLGLEFWGWVLPHGVTELLAVMLCGAAGLVVARSVVFPGRHRRLTNLARNGREAGTIVLGAIAMLFLAALVEGIFRQTVHDVTARWSVAASSAVLWLAYFGLVGRRATG